MSQLEVFDGLVFRLALAALTVLLLASIGGAFVVAVLLIPLHLRAARRHDCGKLEAAFWGLLAVLAVVESAWALTYLFVGETSPAFWIAPTLVAIAAAAGWLGLLRRAPDAWSKPAS